MRKGFGSLAIAVATSVVLLPGTAWALPQTQPDDTWMVDKRVRTISLAGGYVWIGGKFTELQTEDGQSAGSEPFVTALTLDGTPAGVSPPTLTGTTGSEVWDSSLGPDGVLYLAGKFNYSSGGDSYRNLVGIDPTTGDIVRTFRTAGLKSVYADADRVYAGGVKLNAYGLDGKLASGFSPISLHVDDSLRGHTTPEAVRDILAAGAWYVATGQFDYINGDPQKLMFRFDPVTGAVDQSWAPSNLSQQSAAWGTAIAIDGSTVYVAAGGSDYTAAYDLATAQLQWSTDTSGSSQAVSIWDADTLVVGGHFEWVADGAATQCGSNQSPDTSCWKQPRLVALQRSNGDAIKSWTPSVCCAYNGVWATMVEGNRLHIGGEFTKVGGILQRYYGRMTQI